MVTLKEKNIDYSLLNVAEIGPAGSMGVGIAALISGAKTYTVLEALKFKNLEMNLKLFQELIELFQKQSDIPDENEFPKINIRLKSYKFPYDLFPSNQLQGILNKQRLDEISNALVQVYDNKGIIKYYAPWENHKNIPIESFNFVFSRAAMEHVKDFQSIYRITFKNLVHGGVMLHDIEYHSHRTSKYWNGHWCYNSFIWNIIVGSRKFLLNRGTHSMHLKSIRDLQFIVQSESRNFKESKIKKDMLSKEFKHIPDDDLITFGGVIIASKP